ncbi:MAG: TonB-dependent receptor, partial [Moraxellaceae bacterium]
RYAGRGMDGSQFLRESVGLRFEQKNLSSRIQKLEGQLNYNKADHVMDNFSLRQPAPMDMGGGRGHAAMTSTQPMANTPTGTMTGSTMGANTAMAEHDADMDMDAGMGSMSSAMAMQLARKTISGRLATSLNWQDYTLVGGIDASHSEHQGRMGGQYSYRNMPWDKDAEFEQGGIFAELSKPLTEGQTLVSGLRIDQHKFRYLAHDAASQAYATPYGSVRRETLPSGFVRLESQWPEQSLSSYIGLGHVERMPDYWELFTPVHSGSSSAFLGVKPEQTTQLDAGLNYRQGAWSSWLSAYAGKINDYILISYHQHAGHSGNSAGAKNIDASIAGTEAGLAYQLTPNLSTDLNLAYSWGRNDSDPQNNHKPLPQIAPLDVRLGLSYQQDQFSVGGLLRMVDKQNRIALNQGNIVGYDLDKSSRFAVLSLNAAYQFNPAFKLSAGVDNLLDKAYSEHLNRAGNSAFGYAATQKINETGRNFWLRLGFSY